MSGCFRASGLLVIAVLLLSVASPVRAKRADFLFSRKFHGYLALSASGLFLKEAYDSRKDGSDQYDDYKLAGNSQRALELYDESKRKDTRSMVFLGLGVVSLGYSLHLLMSEEEELPLPEMDRGLVEVKGVTLDVTGDPVGRRMRVKFSKGF